MKKSKIKRKWEATAPKISTSFQNPYYNTRTGDTLRKKCSTNNIG